MNNTIHQLNQSKGKVSENSLVNLLLRQNKEQVNELKGKGKNKRNRNEKQ